MKRDFLVLDTEGDPLYEVAIVDAEGKLIYNKNFNFEKDSDKKDFCKFLLNYKDKKIVAHYAEHDKKVLQKVFDEFNIEFKDFSFECTYELSKIYFPNLDNYSLMNIAKILDLKVNGDYVNINYAHRAKYDALVTYKLYKKILLKIEIEKLKDKSNPFSSTRVDNPFQTIPDKESIYANEYQQLKNTLNDIKNDINLQSKGIIILAEPGNGKTHLIMRLANEVIKNNRVFFIRQPNNPNSIKYHIYQRILESLFEKVLDTKYTQLEYLLAKTLSKILIQKIEEKGIKAKLMDLLNQNPLNIFEKFGKSGTKTKRDNWKFIEKITIEYWEEKFGINDFSYLYIKGLIKYCYYSDLTKKEIIKRWLSGIEIEEEDITNIGLRNFKDLEKEEFALEAIITLGKLSLHDEPLILTFDQLEGLKYDEELTIKFLESLKEIFTHLQNSLIICNLFPDRWEWLQNKFDKATIERMGQKVIRLNRPSSKDLKELILFRLKINEISKDIFDNSIFNKIIKASSIREALNIAYKEYERVVYNIEYEEDENSNFSNDIFKEIKDIKESINLILQALNIKNSISKSQVNINKKRVENKKYIVESYFLNKKIDISKKYNISIFSASNDLGSFRKILDSYSLFKKIKIEKSFLQFGRKKLPENIVLNEKIVVCFLDENAISLSARVRNLLELNLTQKDKIFYIIRDSRSNIYTGKKGRMILGNLSLIENFRYIEIGKEPRLIFDTLNQIINEIDNKENNVKKSDLIEYIEDKYPNIFFMKILRELI